jgi:hypothetical protein
MISVIVYLKSPHSLRSFTTTTSLHHATEAQQASSQLARLRALAPHADGVTVQAAAPTADALRQQAESQLQHGSQQDLHH